MMPCTLCVPVCTPYDVATGSSLCVVILLRLSSATDPADGGGGMLKACEREPQNGFFGAFSLGFLDFRGLTE